MKRVFILLFLSLHLMQGYAVLSEQSLEQTISVLRAELEYYKQEQNSTIKSTDSIRDRQHEKVVRIMKESEQVSLMLYSQKQDHTFDLAYACHEATSMYEEFSSHQIPYNKILSNFQHEIDRYNNLIDVLELLPPRLKRMVSQEQLDSIRSQVRVRMDEDGELDSLSFDEFIRQTLANMDTTKMKQKNGLFKLSGAAQVDRDSCIAIAKEIKASLIDMYNSVSEESEHYTFLSQRLKKLNDYALERYNDIKQLIFKNGGENYFVIMKNFPRYWRVAKRDIREKYYQPKDKRVKSEWRGPIVLALSLFIVFYVLIAMALSNVIVRFCVPDKFKGHTFQQKKFYYILAAAVILFAVVVLVMRGVMTHHFFLMASSLLIEYATLVGAVLFSLLIRVNGSQIRSSFAVYLPILLMGFVIIVFRIVFISNSVVNVIFPPLLLIITIWQWISIRRHKGNIQFSDIAYAYISLLVIVVSCIASWMGYTLLAVQIFIWWLFQLTAIQAITCVRDLLKRYEFRFLTTRIMKKNGVEDMGKAARKAVSLMNPTKKEKGNNFEITWFYDLTRITLIPVAVVLSLFLCVYFSAGIFDLTESVESVFSVNFINVEGVCQLSVQKLMIVALLFFSFRFVDYIAKSAYKKYRMKYASDNRDANITLANNIISILIWGIFIIFVLVMLRIPKSGISIVTAGLATGLGFAMKDVLENFIYGLSLMTGRVRVGDYIECDGVRGRVDSITYQSTQIITLDGCVIAFLNTSLFNKNFKNLTRNHGFEFTKLSVGVAYGTDIEKVRGLLKESMTKLYDYERNGLPSVDKDKGIGVFLNEFGSSSVELYVTIWASVEDKFRITGVAKEIIYQTLRENNIEIPFPQRTVHIV
ncbi:MAG: mechanosensitive ion channel [Paludibacteraceae bacterium]|nr:mechanosensitive ion channel [Paludibacteraceae bacterium]